MKEVRKSYLGLELQMPIKVLKYMKVIVKVRVVVLACSAQLVHIMLNSSTK